jgi:hypothetical protein
VELEVLMVEIGRAHGSGEIYLCLDSDLGVPYLCKSFMMLYMSCGMWFC